MAGRSAKGFLVDEGGSAAAAEEDLANLDEIGSVSPLLLPGFDVLGKLTMGALMTKGGGVFSLGFSLRHPPSNCRGPEVAIFV
jgi:hypothetical protein